MKKQNQEVKKSKISTAEQVAGQATLVSNGMEFVSIEDEIYRQYQVPIGDKIYQVRIDNPVWLFVRPSGSHLVIDKDGLVHYIPPFVHLAWKNNDSKTPANF